MNKYIYRREDNGQTVEVDWETMMSQVAGYITLPDGVQARRCVYLECHETKTDAPLVPIKADIVSDTLGVTCHQVEAMRQDAERSGFTDVQFTQDPSEPTFYQARIGSVAEWRRYIKHRGLSDRNGRNGGGAVLSAASLERAKARLLEQEALSK